VRGVAPRFHETASAAETEVLAAELAGTLRRGDLVLVSGDLGAGKTTFVRGAARALGVAGPVASPTFTIGSRHPGRVPVAHLDLFRLDDVGREDPALLADYLTPEVVAFVEWPERAEWPARVPTLRVRLEHLGGDRRRITVCSDVSAARRRGGQPST
jgi:tRNA threonylcarbamoyladenosine biosynthesis protein TsaE